MSTIALFAAYRPTQRVAKRCSHDWNTQDDVLNDAVERSHKSRERTVHMNVTQQRSHHVTSNIRQGAYISALSTYQL